MINTYYHASRVRIDAGHGRAGTVTLVLRVNVNKDTQAVIAASPLRHVCYHSPDGFEWGYGGSGPADLALSILADADELPQLTKKASIEKYRAWRLHQDFKSDYIAMAPTAGFTLSLAEVRHWLYHRPPNQREINLA